MKLYLLAILLIFALALSANSEQITENEVAELIEDYNQLYKNYEGEKNAPVSPLTLKKFLL